MHGSERTVETADFEALLVELASRGLSRHAAAERGGALADDLGATLWNERGVIVDAEDGESTSHRFFCFFLGVCVVAVRRCYWLLRGSENGTSRARVRRENTDDSEQHRRMDAGRRMCVKLLARVVCLVRWCKRARRAKK